MRLFALEYNSNYSYTVPGYPGRTAKSLLRIVINRDIYNNLTICRKYKLLHERNIVRHNLYDHIKTLFLYL